MVDLLRSVTLTVPAGLDAGTHREFEQLVSQLQAQTRTINKALAALTTGAAAPPPDGGMNLDYLGEYVPATYVDGDIVIADDGIAYMCVVDGTTTPPEPWPGIGISTVVGPQGPPGEQGPPGAPGEGAIDATYWTSTAHVTLTAERNFGALATGYVKSIVTDFVSTPITVAVIPLTDGGTGATTAPQARINLGLGTMAVVNAPVSITDGGTGATTAPQARINLGLGTMAVLNSPLSIADGGTGATTAPQARTNLGLGTMAIQNHYDVLITGGQYSVRSGEIIHAVNPSLALTNTGSNTLWLIKTDASTNLDLWSYNVDGSAGVTSVTISRAGVIYANGSALTNLHAPNIATGLVATPRLGNGTASAETYLRGDQTWQPVSGIPSGLIAMFTTSCPIGWTRVSSLDGRFPMGGSSAGGSGGGGSHFHTFSVSTSGAGGHGHSVTGGGSGSATGAVGGTTGGPSIGVQTADAGGSFQTVGFHTHTFNADANLGVSVSVTGSTDSVGDHAHTASGNTSAIASDAADMLPPYQTMVFCQKD